MGKDAVLCVLRRNLTHFLHLYSSMVRNYYYSIVYPDLDTNNDTLKMIMGSNYHHAVLIGIQMVPVLQATTNTTMILSSVHIIKHG